MSGEIADGGRVLFGEEPFLSQARIQDPLVAGFLADVQRTFARGPDEVTATRHMAAILDQAAGRPPQAQAHPRFWSGWRRVAVVLAAALSLSSATVGMSSAGYFTLPKPIRAALSWIGLDITPQTDRSGGSEQGGGDGGGGPGHTGPPVFVPHTPPGSPPGTPPRGIPSNRGDRPDHPRGDHPGRPGGGPGDEPGKGGDRPDRPASPCPFPSDILGCDQDDDGP